MIVHKPSSTPIRRILVALDATRAGVSALESAVTLAACLEAELLGLFVEDVNLLRLAALPFAREIGVASARARRLAAPEMERSLRAQAAAAQRALARAAARSQVRWSFRVVRGEVVSELLAALQEADLLALSMAGAAIRANIDVVVEAVMTGTACPLLVLPPGVAIRPPIVAVYDGSAPSAQALAFAGRLARAEAEVLHVLLVAENTGAEQRLRDEAASPLAESGVAAHFHRAAADAAQLGRALRRHPAGTLVLAGASPALGAEEVRKLLDEVACAVLLIR